MKKLFLMLHFFLLASLCAYAQEKQVPYESYQGCGEYWLAGIVRSTKIGYFVIVNEKTNSEYSFQVPIPEEPKLAPYVDRPMMAKVVLPRVLNGTQGKIEKILEVKHRVPNPLHPVFDTGFKLIKKMGCKK